MPGCHNEAKKNIAESRFLELAHVEALSKISSYPDSNMALYILYTRHCQGACGTQSSPS